MPVKPMCCSKKGSWREEIDIKQHLVACFTCLSISPIILSSLRRSSRLSCSILHQSNTRMRSTAGYQSCSMDDEKSLSLYRKVASTRICLVSGFSTELLEVESEEATLNVVVVPGNPGVVSFYKEFVEALYEQLGGCASITAIGHISHSRQDMAYGRMFSFQEQINHKVWKETEMKDTPLEQHIYIIYFVFSKIYWESG